jgi:rhomboid protease GluP
MNALTQSIRFWETLHHLINREGMRLVHLNEREETAWIEDDRQKPYHLIRLALKNYDWSNQLQRDIEKIKERAQQVRKRLGLRQANVTNVILSAYLPVDDYERYTNEALPLTAGGKKQFRTLILPLGDLKNRLFPIATEWKLKEMPPYLPDSYIEENEQEEHILRTLKYNVKQSLQKQEEKEKGVFLFGKPYFTFLLLGIILLVFGLVEMAGSTTSTLSLIQFGAKFDPLILEGEWWRFFSAMFLHIGFLHLFMNSLALFYLGGAVERIFGTSRFIIIYFLAGFIGSVSSFVFNDNVSAGASGAIFGCFGALLYFGLIHKRLFFRTMGMNVIVILVINLAFGFLVPMVDNGAHIGGLIGGFAGSAIVGLPKQKGARSKILALLAAVTGAAILLFAGYSQDAESERIYVIYYQMARESAEAGDYETALHFLNQFEEGTQYITDDRILRDAAFLFSYTQIRTGEIDEAKEKLEQLVNDYPEFHEAQYNLALIYYEEGSYEEALERVEQALEANPGNNDYQDLKSELEDLIQSS